MKKAFSNLSFTVLAAFCINSVALADPNCPRCDVVKAGRYNQSLIGRTVYLLWRGQFTAVQVVAIDPSMGSLRWRALDGSNREGWDLAANYYSEESRTEYGSQSGGYSAIEQRERDGLLASCVASVPGKDDDTGTIALKFLSKRACCESTASKNWPDISHRYCTAS